MSGDVQPRKRKDKKRRKDEGEQVPIQTNPPSPTRSSSDDVNIHVHKEDGTGGGICAKLVFFVLLSALVLVIGMIITQYRGLTDVETVDTESRFSQIFEGWIDSSPDHHDDHNVEDHLDEHDLDHDDEDDDHDASEDDEEEEEPSEEEEEDDEEDENAEISDERNEDDEDDEDEEEQAVESEENQLDEDEEDDDVQASEEEREAYESEEKDEDDEDDEDEDDHDEDEQELENIGSKEDKDEEDDIDGEASTEKKSGEDNEDEDAEDEDDTNAKKAPVTAKKVTEAAADDAKGEETQQESAGMAVKLGVGVALLVVAHLVLVRKWRTAPEDKPKPLNEEPSEPIPDLKRRNTIIAPPTFQEVEPDIEPEEEDYSEDEDDVSEEDIHEPKSAKTRYQELRSTYTRSITPEGEIDYHKPLEETYDDEYEENVDDEEDEEGSEEEDEDEEKREGEYEEDDEYDEDEDEELLKRLEAKYGKLRGEGAAERQADVENSESEKSDDEGAGYKFSNITNKDDYKIKSDIDEAQKSVKNNSAYAIKLFDKILQNYPSSPRSIYGKASALDYLADQRRSNDILEQALKFYIQLLNTQDVPNALFEAAAERCINRMRFVGQYRNAINVHKLLIQRFPNNPKYSNDLAVTYLTINRVEEALSVLRQILNKWPNDGVALVHYGFILKTTDNELEKAIDYLRKGLDTRAEGVIDGRFYFHLGDALARLGQNDEAMKVYEEGVQNKVFLSKYQRSLYNVPRLTGKPWWELSELPYLDLFRLLKQNWKQIRAEGLAVLNEKGYFQFQDESENLKDTGDWKQFELFARGQRNMNCKACPLTCSIIERIPEARNCKRGQTKFSVMHPGTHVWPHCGPTNCRLRVHLGLKVPPKTFIRVAEETRSWEEGEVFVFDDSFEHEVWHNGTEFRLVLIVDIWHPELTAAEKRGLSPI